MTENETTTRAALALSIRDADAANAVAKRASEAVTSAAAVLREAEHDLQAARAALEGARGVRKPLAELLVSAGSEDERWATVEEYNAPRPVPTAAEIRDARARVLDSEDRIIVSRSELEQLQLSAASATAAANRANDRRQQAIYAVVRPEVARLMDTAEKLTRELGEARLSLRFLGANLTDPFVADERRQISRTLDLDMATLFPQEHGFRAAPSAALALWTQFAERITQDASALFPDAPLN